FLGTLSVCDDYRAIYAQKRCAANTGIIQLTGHRFERWLEGSSKNFPQGRSGEFLLDHLHQHVGRTFDALQHHIARKAIGDDNVGSSVQHIRSFNVADEVDALKSAEHWMNGLHEGITLRVFLAIRHEADPRVLDAKYPARIDVGHHGLLHHVERLGIGNGAEIDYGGVSTFCVRYATGNRRTIDALDSSEHHQ